MEMDMIKWEVVHVPDKKPALLHEFPTVDVYASVIEPKSANTLVRRLNQVAPLENLRHVKRVRKKCLDGGKTQLSVILCQAPDNNGGFDFPSAIPELIKSHQLSAFVTKVSKHAAATKEDWEEQCKLWPTSYHPPTYNIDGILGFNEEDSRSIFRFMKLALGLSNHKDGRVVNAAVFVDPSVWQVIASACDRKCSCYTRSTESCPGANNNIVSPEAWGHLRTLTGDESGKFLLPKNSGDEIRHHLYNNVSCLNPRQWVSPKHSCHTASCAWHPLGHAAIVAIEDSAARDRNLFPGGVHGEYDIQRRCTYSPTKVEGSQLAGNSINFHSGVVRPYLCTGYDAYLVWEPCTMCAMALVHQRIRRIFFAFPNMSAGALGSVHRLQGEKSLNHHYYVFRVILSMDDAKQTMII